MEQGDWRAGQRAYVGDSASWVVRRVHCYFSPLVDGFLLVSKYVVMTQTTRNLGQGGRCIALTTHKQTIHMADGKRTHLE